MELWFISKKASYPPQISCPQAGWRRGKEIIPSGIWYSTACNASKTRRTYSGILLIGFLAHDIARLAVLVIYGVGDELRSFYETINKALSEFNTNSDLEI
jgi:hypothetical protein